MYKPIRSFEEVSGSFIGDLINRVFGGSREKMLVRMFGGDRPLSAAERKLLEDILGGSR